MLTKPKTVTPRQLLANRRNAQKSTGPRTRAGKMKSRMNAFKHGQAARKLELEQVIRGLDEDPREFAQLHAELAADLKPANAVERKLVEDLAKLWWKRQRAERAELGVQLRDVERLKIEHAEALAQANRGPVAESRQQIAEIGLRRAADCPAKFEQIHNVLDVLVARLERRDYDPDVKSLLRLLYGENPTLRGALIHSLFEALVNQDYSLGADEEEDDGEPWPGLDQLSPTAPADPPDLDPGEVRLRAALMVALQEEIREVLEEQEAYLSRFEEISPAAKLARLAPTDRRWTWLLRMDNMLDRQIERKLNTLARVRQTFRTPDGPPRPRSRGFAEGNQPPRAPRAAVAKSRAR